MSVQSGIAHANSLQRNRQSYGLLPVYFSAVECLRKTGELLDDYTKIVVTLEAPFRAVGDSPLPHVKVSAARLLMSREIPRSNPRREQVSVYDGYFLESELPDDPKKKLLDIKNLTLISDANSRAQIEGFEIRDFERGKPYEISLTLTKRDSIEIPRERRQVSTWTCPEVALPRG